MFDFNQPKNKAVSDTFSLEAGDYLEYLIHVNTTGRYQISITGLSDSGWVWVEDYADNKDERTYNISGNIKLTSRSGSSFTDGSPLQKGSHLIRVHAVKGTHHLTDLKFLLLRKHKAKSDTLVQSMTGNSWQLKWSDEFNTDGLPDSSTWQYNLGNWGWGNNELQYYTVADTQNAIQKNGALRIKAIEKDGKWTSARLTTQGKLCFTYGRIEIRAKVPKGRGSWSAGWTLGDDYKDEISWPYCGEIDILESVGYEFDSLSGTGRNHASCHTPAYYFKKGNHITADTAVEHMSDSFHTYSIDWYPTYIEASVDGKVYYTYDKTTDTLEWPFYKPQNLILNLAIGGGWGGAKGMDPNMKEQELWIDYVRVYEKTN
jgi:beta-glucanase (GH16 family)